MDTFPYLFKVRAARRRWLDSGQGEDLQAWFKACQALEKARAVAHSQRVTAGGARGRKTGQASACDTPDGTEGTSRATFGGGLAKVQAPAR